MAPSDPDWWARAISGIALLISAATFIWTRIDKRRDRKASEQALLPTIRMTWNPRIDERDWYTLSVAFRDLQRGIRFDRARVIKPRGAILANVGALNAPERGGPSIPIDWELQVVVNPIMGDAVKTQLYFRPPSEADQDVTILLEGHFLSGTMKPIKMNAFARKPN